MYISPPNDLPEMGDGGCGCVAVVVSSYDDDMETVVMSRSNGDGAGVNSHMVVNHVIIVLLFLVTDRPRTYRRPAIVSSTPFRCCTTQFCSSQSLCASLAIVCVTPWTWYHSSSDSFPRSLSGTRFPRPRSVASFLSRLPARLSRSPTRDNPLTSPTARFPTQSSAPAPSGHPSARPGHCPLRA